MKILYTKDMWNLEDKFKLSLVFLALCFTCSAQFRPQYSQYMFNGLAINPAYAGSKEALNVAALYRSSQWGKGISGAPVTQTVAGDFPLPKQQIAVGVLIFNDQIHNVRNTGAYFAYAYRIKTDYGKLAFGMQAGIDLQHEDQSDFYLIHPDDPKFHMDVNNILMPNFGVGTYFQRSNVFGGISLPQLFKYTTDVAKAYNASLTLNSLKLYGGTIIPAGKDFKLKPTTLIQFTGNGMLLDVNCNFILMQERLELGLSLRTSGVLVALAQFRVNQLRIGYSHDYGIGKPSAINTTHEIMLRYDLNFRVNAVSPLHF